MKKKKRSGKDFQDRWTDIAFELFLSQLVDTPPMPDDHDGNAWVFLQRIELAFFAGYHTASMAVAAKERFGDPLTVNSQDLERVSIAMLKGMIGIDKKRIFENQSITDKEKEIILKEAIMQIKDQRLRQVGNEPEQKGSTSAGE